MRHGGDIYRNAVQLDYSVNMNPLGIPESVTKALIDAVGCCTQYPDVEHEVLKKALAEYEQTEYENIVCGNGASELFVAVEHAIKPKKTLIPVPSFYGYEHASHTEQSEITFYPMKEENNYKLDDEILDWLTKEIDLLYLANPNNPTGQLIPIPLLHDILRKCERCGIYVVLDECFLPFCEEAEGYETLFKEKSFAHLVRVRAFTKTFSIPGVRLGYLICTNRELRKQIELQLPEWNLSVFAQMAGVAAVKEKAFLDRSKALLTKERQWLCEELARLVFQVVPSAVNFILFRSREPLYEKLLEQGILIRDCSNFHGLGEGYYRIAVKTREENERLIQAMKWVIERKSNALGEIQPDQSNLLETEIEFVLPHEIEKRSFEIISKELQEKAIVLPAREELVTKRAIHTSADFEYAKTLCFSKDAVEIAKQLIRNGADIVTDTNMALAGINKKRLAEYGGQVHCFMADADVAQMAKERQVTRATISMEKASKIEKPVIIAVGNAPTALIELEKMIRENVFRPSFIIGVPVGFVNVVQAKELIMKTDIPYIVNRGRKGGSNIAAAICNAILYQL